MTSSKYRYTGGQGAHDEVIRFFGMTPDEITALNRKWMKDNGYIIPMRVGKYGSTNCIVCGETFNKRAVNNIVCSKPCKLERNRQLSEIREAKK